MAYLFCIYSNLHVNFNKSSVISGMRYERTFRPWKFTSPNLFPASISACAEGTVAQSKFNAGPSIRKKQIILLPKTSAT